MGHFAVTQNLQRICRRSREEQIMCVVCVCVCSTCFSDLGTLMTFKPTRRRTAMWFINEARVWGGGGERGGGRGGEGMHSHSPTLKYSFILRPNRSLPPFLLPLPLPSAHSIHFSVITQKGAGRPSTGSNKALVYQAAIRLALPHTGRARQFPA